MCFAYCTSGVCECMRNLRVVQVYRVGPKRVASLSRDTAGIYLPKELSFLKGKLVQLTIEVLEEVSE